MDDQGRMHRSLLIVTSLFIVLYPILIIASQLSLMQDVPQLHKIFKSLQQLQPSSLFPLFAAYARRST